MYRWQQHCYAHLKKYSGINRNLTEIDCNFENQTKTEISITEQLYRISLMSSLFWTFPQLPCFLLCVEFLNFSIICCYSIWKIK